MGNARELGVVRGEGMSGTRERGEQRKRSGPKA